MRSKLVLAVTILATILLQSTLVPQIAIGSIKPNLIVIFCISMGLMRGRKAGLWTGFFTGLFMDFFYGSVFGVYALIYMYVGYLSGYACMVLYDDDIKVPLFLAGAGDLFYNVAVYVLLFLLRGRLGVSTYLFRIIIPEMFYTLLLTFPVYRIYYFINYRLMTMQRKESESVWVLK
ncbi:MAG: rod shape-determining protein MreD [Clostridiales bacterium]|nr:rod shape-determining protein MreD [Candidatus Blautia equi]